MCLSLLGLDEQEVLASGLLFILAGFDTVANTLSMLCYCLACNPDCQTRAQEEVDRVLGDKVRYMS